MEDSNWVRVLEECSNAWRPESGLPIKIKILMDKGTRMREQVEKEGCECLVPSTVVDGYITIQDIEENEKIAKARGHVERAIGEIKRFNILTGVVHHGLAPVLGDTPFFCCFATHLVVFKDVE